MKHENCHLKSTLGDFSHNMSARYVVVLCRERFRHSTSPSDPIHSGGLSPTGSFDISFGDHLALHRPNDGQMITKRRMPKMGKENQSRDVIEGRQFSPKFSSAENH